MTVFSPDGLLTVREVAETMRVSTMTVYRLIKAHELSATRVGKHFRIRRRDLVAYLDARRVGPDPTDAPHAPSDSPGDSLGESLTPSQDDAARKGDQWPAA